MMPGLRGRHLEEWLDSIAVGPTAHGLRFKQLPTLVIALESATTLTTLRPAYCTAMGGR
jgi:hypothetical protein